MASTIRRQIKVPKIVPLKNARSVSGLIVCPACRIPIRDADWSVIREQDWLFHQRCYLAAKDGEAEIRRLQEDNHV